MTDTISRAAAPSASADARKYYFIAWRWHFYAGLYVIPFLCMLAITGLTMLWISWGAGLGAERMAVTPQGGTMANSALEAAAEVAVSGGHATQYVEPLADNRIAAFAVETGAGTTGVAIDPYSGAVMKTFPWRAGWYDFATDIHGTLLLGRFGDRMIEIAASLAIIMIATGLYLHWPRNGSGWRAALVPQLSLRKRALWKSIHGVTGMWISLVLLVFLLSGLSWAGIWGEKMVQAWNTFPAEKWGAPLSDSTHADMNHGNTKEVPWGLEQTPLPESGSLAGVEAISGEVDIDSVAAFARSLGFNGRFQVYIPADATGVWTVSHDSMSNDGPNPTADRTIHIDQYTGRVLADVGFADYSPYAKAMAVGIAFHEGDLGVWNLVLNTVFCLSVVLVWISGAIMWWKRRPGTVGTRLFAPPRPKDLPFWKGAALLVVALGIVFPMAGFAIALILLLDATVLRFLPGIRRALS
ncbi:PepSY-associated TM helix domain-containing protein [Martelella radicis]|uniref:Putative iron-regulated membrane protein n=1 Tax=Martelella radicis TaxID=1397476 RepID=A0A7W6PC02_9HYPH|nr:PepSY domain-containing protein [Martelella radicis]MBB4124450.1 putative iron-regulated membrane protein [Martelella radicis]